MSRKLYLVLEGGRAMRYPIAVGREGISFRGNGVIGRKEEWPVMAADRQHGPHKARPLRRICRWPAGRVDQPAGRAGAVSVSRRPGHDVPHPWHGFDNASIGHATSAGCIRLFNQDAIDLYTTASRTGHPRDRPVRGGKPCDGRAADDRRLWSRRCRKRPENIAKKEKDLAAIEKQAEKDRVAAEKAEKKRLAACDKPRHRRRGMPPSRTEAVVTVGTSSGEATSG
jgi:hypothetical protein